MPSRPRFRPFDPHAPLRIYVRNLPHWRQPGATYFVTFRQDDSIPKAVLAEWLDHRARWFKAHGLSTEYASQLASRKSQRGPGWESQATAAYRRIPFNVRRAFERE